MMHHDVLLQLTRDRCERLQRQAENRRLALQVREQPQRRLRRRALRVKQKLAA